MKLFFSPRELFQLTFGSIHQRGVGRWYPEGLISPSERLTGSSPVRASKLYHPFGAALSCAEDDKVKSFNWSISIWVYVA